MKKWIPSLGVLAYLAAVVVGNEVQLVRYELKRVDYGLIMPRLKMTPTGKDAQACTVARTGVDPSTRSYKPSSYLQTFQQTKILLSVS